MEKATGVTNPYAIAELVAGRKIHWNSFDDSAVALSAILRIPQERIFADDSPVLRPDAVIDVDGTRRVLSLDESRNRLRDYLKSNLIPSTDPRPSVLTPRFTRLRALTESQIPDIVDLLTPSQTLSGTQPWHPDGTEWIDKGDYFEDVSEFSDPIQGALGDCYLIAAMSSVVWSRPYAIANFVRPSSYGDDEGPIHRITFHKPGSSMDPVFPNGRVEVSEQVPVVEGSHSWIYARSDDPGEIWPAVLEKAYAKWKTRNTTDFPDYRSIAGGSSVMACAELVGGEQHSVPLPFVIPGIHQPTINCIKWNSVGRRTSNPMVASTYDSAPSGLDYNAARVVGNHAYSVLGWESHNGTYYVVLRNPWGAYEATLDVLSGNWNCGAASVPLNTKGIFAMKVSTFDRYFARLGWVD